jgi:hypothetical protein
MIHLSCSCKEWVRKNLQLDMRDTFGKIYLPSLAHWFSAPCRNRIPTIPCCYTYRRANWDHLPLPPATIAHKQKMMAQCCFTMLCKNKLYIPRNPLDFVFQFFISRMSNFFDMHSCHRSASLDFKFDETSIPSKLSA